MTEAKPFQMSQLLDAVAAPVLLLDDPFAELDDSRAARILALLDAGGLGQVLLAVPRAGDVPPTLSSLARRTIRDGAVT